MCLHLVENLGLLRGQERAQFLFHLFVERLHLWKIGAQDRFELGPVAFGDLVRFRFLYGREAQRAGGTGKEWRERSRPVRRPVVPVRHARTSNCPE
jgi:hypothetical protein